MAREWGKVVGHLIWIVGGAAAIYWAFPDVPWLRSWALAAAGVVLVMWLFLVLVTAANQIMEWLESTKE